MSFWLRKPCHQSKQFDWLCGIFYCDDLMLRLLTCGLMLCLKPWRHWRWRWRYQSWSKSSARENPSTAEQCPRTVGWRWISRHGGTVDGSVWPKNILEPSLPRGIYYGLVSVSVSVGVVNVVVVAKLRGTGSPNLAERFVSDMLCNRNTWVRGR